jgi:DNA-binding transcriptional ArsR family regulator
MTTRRPRRVGDAWLDSEAGPVVRPYAMTSGRTRPTHGEFSLISIVLATCPAAPGLPPEAAEIVRYAQEPVSVAEIAAHLDLPAGTVKVLLGDLLDAGLIHTPAPGRAYGVPDEPVLKAVVHALRAL